MKVLSIAPKLASGFAEFLLFLSLGDEMVEFAPNLGAGHSTSSRQGDLYK